jgi:hypothetical protein
MTLVIKVFNKAGLEMKDYRDYFRLVIKELDRGATNPRNKDVTIQQAMEIQLQNVKGFIKND